MNALEFRQQHGDPATWSDDVYDLYISSARLFTQPAPTPQIQPVPVPAVEPQPA